jgi:general secretion pathway protein N
MKKIGWKIFAIFVITFIVMLIVTAPAALYGKVAEVSSNGQITLANTSGTVWQGSATPAIRQRTGNYLVLERLNWDVSLLPLFTGKIMTRFRWDNWEQAPPMLAIFSLNSIELKNVLLPLHVGILSEFLPLLQPVQLSGQLQIKSDNLVVTKQGVSGNAVADWINAGSVLSAVRPLGHYKMTLSSVGEKINISLETMSGILQLNGSGVYARNSGATFQVTARSAAANSGGIDELLSNFGPESAPGVHTLNLTR